MGYEAYLIVAVSGVVDRFAILETLEPFIDLEERSKLNAYLRYRLFLFLLSKQQE